MIEVYINRDNVYKFENKRLEPLYPFHKPGFIALICIDFDQTTCFRLCINHQFLTNLAILRRSARDDHQQQQSEHIDDNISLPPLDILVLIVAYFFSTMRRLYALTINKCNTWFRLASKLDPQLFSETVIDPFECSIFQPGIVLVRDKFPWGEIMW